MKLKILPIILLAVLLGGCTFGPPPPQLNPLQIQAMQTQEFTASKKKTFDAAMTVLQNDGYVITTADLDTGFITAKGPTQDNFGQQVHLSITAFVTTYKSKGKTISRVRLSFVQNTTVSGQQGTFTQDQQILDTGLYKKTFNDIRQQVFVAGSM